jgi:hypothetical protein
MKNRAYLTLPVIILTICAIGLFWTFNNSGKTVSQVTNNVTNDITHNVVEYETIKVEDLQTAVNEVVKKVEDAVIGVTRKEVVKSNFGK